MVSAARFGDFALLDDLGQSEVADRYRAMHDAQGGPFFVKAYVRLPGAHGPDLQTRAGRLIGVRDPRIVPHLGHGLVDGVPFTVAPWVDGFNLEELGRSLRERRVTLSIEALLAIVREVALAVDALHSTSARDATGEPLAHGEVTSQHVRITREGAVVLTGAVTPRGHKPGAPLDPALDAAGIGATIYDLIAMTRPGGVRAALPLPLERLVRRALGIGPQTVRLTPKEIAESVVDVADALRVDLATAALPELALRTLKALGRRGRALSSNGAADTLPMLEPIAERDDSAPTLPKTRGTPELVALDVPPARPRPSPPPPAKAIPADISGGNMASPRPVESPPPLRPPPKTPAPSTTPTVPPPIAAPPKTPAPTGGESRVPVIVERVPEAPKRAPPPSPVVEAAASQSVTVKPPPRPAPAPSTTSPVATLRPPPREAPLAPAPSTTTTAPSSSKKPDAPKAPAPITALTELPPDLRSLSQPSGDGDPWASPPPFTVDEPAPLAEPTIEGPFELFSVSERTTPEIAALPGDERVGLRDLGEKTRHDGAPSTTLVESGPQRRPTALDDPTTSTSRTPRLADLPPDEKTRDGPPVATITASEVSAEPVTDDRSLVPSEPSVRALLERGAITRTAVQRAIEQQRRRGGRVLDILVADGVIGDGDLADALADEAVKPRISDDGLQRRLPAPELVKKLPQTFATEHRVLPLRLDGGVLVLAVVDPFDERAPAEVSRIYAAKSVHVHVATRAAMTRAIAVAYRRGADASAESPLVLLCAADDDLAGRVGARLATEGLRIELANSLALARRVLGSHAPDACLVSDELPDGLGTDLLVEARGEERTHDLPMFVFGKDEAASEARALDLGADDYFATPLHMDVVVRKLRRALAKRPPKKPAPPPPTPTVDLSPFGEGAIPGGFDVAPGGGEFGAVVDDAPAEPTGVMGTLKQMSVAEIVQSLELGRKTARVELVPNDGPKGVFAFDTGQIVFATRDDGLEGEKAFYALAKHQEGFFRIHYGDQGPRRNIDKPTTFLLLEAMRLMDEDGRPEGSV